MPVWEAVGEQEAPSARPRPGRAARRPRRRARPAARRSGTRACERAAAGARDDPRRPRHRQEPAPDRARAPRAPASADVLWGRCLSYGEGITYWPVEEILEDAAGILHERRRRGGRRRSSARCSSGSATDDPDELRTIAAALANLDRRGRARRTARTRRPRSRRPSSTGASAACSSCSPRERPLVLVFEDLHWAEPTLLELIEFIGEAARRRSSSSGSARRELRETGSPRLRAPTRTAHDARASTPSSSKESEALLAELLGERELPPAAAPSRCSRNAGGNPLFLEETVRMLDDAGALDGGRASCRRRRTSLQAMIGSRLDGSPARTSASPTTRRSSG